MASHTVHPRCNHSRTTGLDGGHHRQSATRGHSADDLGGTAVAVRQSRRPKGYAIHFHHRNWIRCPGGDDDTDLLQMIWMTVA